MSVEELADMATQVRRDIVRMVHAAQSGHPGGSLGCTDLLVALYFRQMEIATEKGEDGFLKFNMDGTGEDVFFLSNGHISPVFYAALSRRGYFPLEEMGTFRQINSRVQGHPTTHEHLPGIRIASGSLGQGCSVAIGAALAKKLNNDDKLVYILMGDGEQQEGQVWEAAQFAAHHQVDNLVAFIDLNGQQIDGSTENVMDNRDLGAKYEAFGWDTVRVANGNDMKTVVKMLEDVKGRTGNGKPVMVLLETEMGAGVDFMMGSHKWHGVAPDDDQLQKALDQLRSSHQDY